MVQWKMTQVFTGNDHFPGGPFPTPPDLDLEKVPKILSQMVVKNGDGTHHRIRKKITKQIQFFHNSQKKWKMVFPSYPGLTFPSLMIVGGSNDPYPNGYPATPFLFKKPTKPPRNGCQAVMPSVVVSVP